VEKPIKIPQRYLLSIVSSAVNTILGLLVVFWNNAQGFFIFILRLFYRVFDVFNPFKMGCRLLSAFFEVFKAFLLFR